MAARMTLTTRIHADFGGLPATFIGFLTMILA